jgi:hypothetical protein
VDFYGCARGDGGKFSAILVGCDSVLFAGEGISVDILSDFKREGLEGRLVAGQWIELMIVTKMFNVKSQDRQRTGLRASTHMYTSLLRSGLSLPSLSFPTANY